jgi:hypothetical protein
MTQAANGTTTTINAPANEGDYRLFLIDAAGNISSASTAILTVDNTPPVVATVVATSGPLKGIGSTRGIVATSVNFDVTFTETYATFSGIDASDFSILKDASLTIGPLSISGSGNIRTINVPIVSGTGKISLGVTDDDTILDPAGNRLGGTGAGNGNFSAAYVGTQYYTIAFPEPTNDVAAITTSAITTTSITVQWNQPGGLQAATHYLVMAKPNATGSFTINPPVDGTYYINSALTQNVVIGGSPQTTTFNSLNSGTGYDFIIFPYTLGANNSNDNIDFKTTLPATITNAVTTVGSASTLTLTPTPVAVSSIINTSGTAVNVLTYNLRDDGLTPLIDNTPVKFTQLIFNNGNPSLNWANILAGAILSDGTNSLTSTTITSNSITFPSIPSSVGSLGYIADDATKNYTLKVWLKDPITVEDKSILGFVFGNTDFTYDNTSNSQISSRLAVQTINSGLNIKIDVIATSLDFVTQPSIFAGVDEDINASTGYSTGIVHARDEFANLDTDFNFDYVLSAAAGAVRNPATATFTNGVLDLVGMKYNTWGIGTLTVTSNGLTSANNLSVNSKPCDPINVISVSAIKVISGQPASASLRGGNVNTTIFGVFLKPNHFVSNQPLLKSLTFEFSTPYRTATRTTFKNFKVFEKRADSARVSADNVSAFATLTEIESVPGSGNFDRVKVAFTSDRPLYPDGSSPATVTYFLETDIDVTASNNTPKITPRLVDLGQGDNRIEITQGSAKVTVTGREYSFASTRPPLLVGASCVPPTGTLNVSKGITSIGLTFDVPVVTFDKVAKLYYYNTNTLVATLEATNGIFDSGTAIINTPPVKTMNFKIPDGVELRPDSVYYVTLAQGKYDPNTKTGEGLSDDQLNLYGGITYKGIYYFKIASNKPPAMVSTDATKYEATPTFASLNASFDQKGKGYYLILPSGASPAPTAIQVKSGTYGGKLSSGTFAIDQLAPNLQYFTATGSFTGTGHQVWIVAENDAPDLPRPSSGVFGSSPNFTAGATGPTFTFSQFTPTGANATPNFQLCPGSFSVVSQPIVLRESNSTGTNATWGTGTQNFNILLPAGFTFDIDYAPTIEQVGADFTIARTGTITASTSSTTVTGSGTFFLTQLAPGHILKNSSGTTIGVVAAIANNTSLTLAVNASVALTNGAYRSEQLPTFKFINSTLLRVTFENAGSSSDDRLIVSSMRIAPSSVSSSGEIIRFGGSGLANYGDLERLATIRASALAPQAFTNRYTQFNNFGSSVGINSVVTSIPDNFLDPDLSNRNVVRLIPKITPSNDYNASFFSGAGVTDDVLSLSGVSKDVAFDITMTRTDLNGCFLSQKEQYLVYDNTKIIPKLTIPVFGPKQAVKNPNYKTPQDVDAPDKGAPVNKSAQTLAAKDIAGYSMEQMVLKIPKEIKTFSVVPTRESQIIQDAAWQAQLDRVLVQEGATRTNNNGTIERDYKWDFSHILNAKRVTGGVDKDPYVHFQATSPQGQTYYKGGSLGSVDFIGKFRNDADLLVFQPLVQRIELFVPAVPVIEVVGQFFKKPATASSPDIYVFCERGSDILFNGYPAASPGKSKAFYRLYDDETDTPLTGSGFTDNANSNGTATLTPSSTAFLNDYKVIRVEYTYQDDNSPAIGTGKFYIQIAPNPIANFKFRSVKLGTKSPNASDTLAICSNNEIIFDASSSKLNGVEITPSSNAKFKYTWNFDDSKSSSPKPDSLRFNNPTHTFADVRNYNVTLSLVSDVGCPSIPQAVPQGSIPGPKTIVVKVGDIPVVDFSFLGNCVGDAITFTDASKTDAATSAAARYDWDFGDGQTKFGFNSSNPLRLPTDPNIFPEFPRTPDGKVVTNTYSLPKSYDVKLTTTTSVGCSNSTTKKIVQLPVKVATQGADFSEFFDASDGGWQALDLTGATPEPRGSIREVSIFNAGAAYTNGIYINRVLTGGTGNGAIADVTVAGGVITALDVRVKGTGYKIGDLLSAAIPAGTGLSIRVAKIADPSWVHNDPTAPGEWITKSYKQNERSALYSACLDLSNVPRPVISFSSNIGLDTGEGLVLQYSKDQKNIYDPSKGWDVLGTTVDGNSPGLGWYNQNALPSNPGTGYTNAKNVSGYGWAGSLGYTVPKHKIEDVIDYQPDPPVTPPLANNRTIFRFALAALSARGQGIKIDSVRVGSRTRTILFENFTTTDGGTNTALNTNLKADADFIKKFTNDNITSTQLVNLNYHIGFVGKDPFNLDNPADPSSRALFYNVSKVPYAFLDGKYGGKNGSDLFKDWGQAAYDLQTLQLANADFTPVGTLVTNVVNNATDKTMEIEVYVKPTRDLPASTRLHIGILEDQVLKSELLSKKPGAIITTGENEFNYVVKQMLPNALGTRYPSQTFKRDVLVRLAPGGKVGGTEKFKWTADKLYSNNLTVVVFLQDTLREVYQADLIRNLTPPAPITGFEPIAADQVYVYPNPTDQEFTIELPVNLKSDAAVRLIDQVGRTHAAGNFAAGKNAKTVSTEGLASGVYIVEIRAEDGALIRKKVMVVH